MLNSTAIQKQIAQKLENMKTGIIVSLFLALLSAHLAYGNDMALDKPIPPSAKKLAESCDKLTEMDQFQLEQMNLKKAIAIAPNYVYAHAKYVRLQEVYFNRRDDVIEEYAALMRKEPGNPVYPMALAVGIQSASDSDRQKWAGEVVRLAPDWIWSHYARSMLIDSNKVAEKVSELKQFIAGDGLWPSAYYTFESYQKKLNGADDSILSAFERLSTFPVSRSKDLVHLWELRLDKEKRSADSVNALKTTLSNIVATSRDVKVLVAAYMAYDTLLKSADEAANAKKAILKIDSTWYPERGQVTSVGGSNVTGFTYVFNVANHQFVIYNKIVEVIESSFSGKISPEEELLQLKGFETSPYLSSQLKRYLRVGIFYAAAEVKDVDSLTKYGRLLFTADPTDVAIPTVIAKTLVDKVQPAAALQFAEQADRATAEFQILSRPKNNGLTEDSWKRFASDEWQRQRHAELRSQALDALGRANFRLGNLKQAEAYLNQSVSISESETNLGHLSEVYEKSGKKDQADIYRKRSADFYRNGLKKGLVNEKVKDFEFRSVDGKTIKLSDLRGKVVLLDVWATWCAPCMVSIPHLIKTYEKLRNKGFEILFVSVDSDADKSKVTSLAKEMNIPFPVVFDSGFREAYGIDSFPTSFFIDPNGNIRRRESGFDAPEATREINVMFDLLKNEEPAASDSAK